VFCGHGSVDRVADVKQTATRNLRMGLALILSSANVSFWIWIVSTGYAVPLEAYADPSPLVITESGGMRFDMCSHCGRGFALAGMEPLPMWLEEREWVRAARLANFPGVLVAKIAGLIAEGPIGQFGAMWTETVVFALASTAQWIAAGWALGSLAGRLPLLRHWVQHS
jgi:hypothetical protein